MLAKRILSGLLALVLLLGNVPVTAFASEAEPMAAPIVLEESPAETPAEILLPETTDIPPADTTVEPTEETEAAEETTAAAEEVPLVIVTEEANQSGTTSFDAFCEAIQAAINAGADENGSWEYRHTQPLTIEGNETLDIVLPDGFDLYFVGSTLTIAENATLNLNTSIELQFATMNVNGTVNVGTNGALFVNNTSTLNVSGTLNNYDCVHVGYAYYAWDGGGDTSITAGTLNILSGGTMNNYHYLSVMPYDAVYNDAGDLDHTSGGQVNVHGTLNNTYYDNGAGFVSVGGKMLVTGQLLTNNYEQGGAIEVSQGNLDITGTDTSGIPDGYVIVHPAEGGTVSGLDNSRMGACYNAYSDEDLLAWLKQGSNGYYSIHINTHGERTLTQDVTIDPSSGLVLAVQPTFDENGTATGGSLTIAEGVELTLNNTMLYVNGTLILAPSSDPENDATMLSLNDGSVAEVRGTVENHGSILIGIWRSPDKANTSSGGMAVIKDDRSDGTLDNYGYIGVYAFEDMYENGELIGYSGGWLHVYGTLNTQEEEASVSCIDINGDLIFFENSQLVYDNPSGYFIIHPTAYYEVKDGASFINVPEDYPYIEADQPLSQADFEQQVQDAIDRGSRYLRVVQEVTITEDLTLDLPYGDDYRFDLELGNTLTIAQGVTLTVNGGTFGCHGGSITVNGTLNIGSDCSFYLNGYSFMEVNGTVNHYGWMGIGGWMELDKNGAAGELAITGTGVLNNYGHIDVMEFGDGYDEQGNVNGKTGGSLIVNGALNMCYNDQRDGWMNVWGTMTVGETGSFVVGEEERGGIRIYGTLTVANANGFSTVPDGYIGVAVEDGGSCVGLDNSRLCAVYTVYDNDALYSALSSTASSGYASEQVQLRGHFTLSGDVTVAAERNLNISIEQDDNGSGSLTIASGIGLRMNYASMNVCEGTQLVLEKDAYIHLSDESMLWVGGTVENHGGIFVGPWKSIDKDDGFAGHLYVETIGTLDNYGFIRIYEYGQVPEDFGDEGKRGGLFQVHGTLNLCADENGSSEIMVQGDLWFREGSTVEHFENDGYIHIAASGSLDDQGANLVNIPEGYITYESGEGSENQEPISVEEFLAELEAAMAQDPSQVDYYAYQLFRPLTISEDLTLPALPENFCVDFMAPVTIEEDAALNFAGGNYWIHGADMILNGTLNIPENSGLLLNGHGYLEINGTLNNRGFLQLGDWMELEKEGAAGEVTINESGVLNNYGHIEIREFGDAYNGEGNVDGKTGGSLVLMGTMNAYYSDDRAAAVNVRGSMNVTETGRVVVQGEEARGEIAVHGTLTIADAASFDAVPDRYVVVLPLNGGSVKGLDNGRMRLAIEVYEESELTSALKYSDSSYASTEVHLFADAALTEEITIHPKLNHTFIVHEGHTLTIPSEGYLGLNNAYVGVNGTMIMEPGARVEISNTATLDVWGHLENHGRIHVGMYKDPALNLGDLATGHLYINGTLDNYGYVNVMPFDGDENGETGGVFIINGTLNTRTDADGTSFIEVGGEMRFESGSVFGCHDTWTDPMLVLHHDGYLWFDDNFDASSIPEGYMTRQAPPAITLEELIAGIEDTMAAGPDENGNYYYEVRQPLTISDEVTLELPENFDINFMSTVTVEEGASLTLAVDGSYALVEANEAEFFIFGTLTINQGVRVVLNTLTEMSILGTLNNYGDLILGEYTYHDNENPGGRLVISPDGILNNYSYIQIREVSNLYDESGNLFGRTGGHLHMNGTLNAYHGETDSYIEVGGNLDLNNGSKTIAHNAEDSGLLDVLQGGTLQVAERADVSQVPDGYISVNILHANYSGLEKSRIMAVYTADNDDDLDWMLCNVDNSYHSTAVIALGDRTLQQTIGIAPFMNMTVAVTGSLTIPSGMELNLNNVQFRLPEGAQLTVEPEGALWLNNGTFAWIGGRVTNHGWFHVGNYASTDYEDSFPGHLYIAEGGVVETDGYLAVHAFQDIYENDELVGYGGGYLGVNGELNVFGTGFVDVSGELVVEENAYVTDEHLGEGGVGTMINPIGHLENYGGQFGGNGVFWAMSEVKITNNESTGKPKLTWEEVTDAKSYQIYRSTTGKAGSFTLQYTTTNLYYNDTKAAVGTRYYYRVRAVLKTGSLKTHSAWSNDFDEPITTICDLARPGGLKVANDADTGKPVISWNKVTGATKYQIYYSTKSTGTFKLLQTTTSLKHTHAKAVAGTKYYYKVKAIYGSQTQANSAMTGWYASTCDLPRPTGVKTSNNAATGKNVISWNKVEGATKYQVWYSTTGKAGSFKVLMTTKNLTHTHSKAVAGKTYYYKVLAVHSNTAANSALTSYFQRVCDLAKPTGIKVAQNTATVKNRISWSKVTGAVKYQVWSSTTGKAGSFKLLTTTKNLFHVHKGGIAGTRYYYKVLAVHSNTAANSAYSDVVNRISK